MYKKCVYRKGAKELQSTKRCRVITVVKGEELQQDSWTRTEAWQTNEYLEKEKEYSIAVLMNGKATVA